MKTRQPSVLDALNMEHALEFSCRAHHSEKIDYLCLFRSTAITVKAYFFDEGQDDNVVVPHTHRYSFDTRVVRGGLRENKYRRNNGASLTPLARFAYSPIVDGGCGFDSGGGGSDF